MSDRHRAGVCGFSRRGVVLVPFVLLLASVAAACGGGSGAGTAEPQPVLKIGDPTSASLLLPFRIAGWGLDLGSSSGPGVERIEVLDGGCDGDLLGLATHGISRPDVAARYGDRFAESGWELVLERLNVGEHVRGVRLKSALRDASVCETIGVSVV
jgi:hypothetical protein